VNDWFFKRGGRDRMIDWLGIDAWLDSSLAGAWARCRDGWSAASSFFARFKLTGWQKLLNEFLSEGLTLGAGGLVVAYMLAIPAFQEIDGTNWRNPGKYSVTFLDRNGTEIGRRGINLNDAVPLEEIPETVIKATLATEDRRFFEHIGVDFLGTARALSENLKANEVVQGGSTLTQQLAKNLFLSSERSIIRKIKEVYLAFWLEAHLTKREILKMYLDRAYLGGGAFGVEAASQYYFGKSVRDVTMAEAALLAGLYKAPTKFAPHVNLPASRARTSEVLSNLVEAGFYTSGQVQEARLNPAQTIEHGRTDSPDYYLDWAFDEVQRVMQGRGDDYVLTARTTVDLRMQSQAEEALKSTVRQFGRSRRLDAGAIVSMSPDGAVRAIVGGLDYGESQFNRATQARRQPGSSFKLYVYAAAIESGMTPNSTVRDASRSCGRWHPKNYSGSHGSGSRMPLWMAFAKSLNTTAAELSFQVGRDEVLEMTKRLGVGGVRKTCSMALGDTGITPLEHTGAYAHFANGGRAARPYAILEIQNTGGELIYSRDRDEPPPVQVVERRVAEQMNQVMQRVVTDGTGRRAALDFTHTVGKTGTSSSYRDGWFVGFSGALVTGVWLGNDDFRPTGRVSGGNLPAQTWHAFMAVAHQGLTIPVIPGLSPHPMQVADQQRLAALGRSGEGQDLDEEGRRRSSLLSEETRSAIEKLAQTLRKVSGIPQPEAETEGPQSPTPTGPGGRRAEVRGAFKPTGSR